MGKDEFEKSYQENSHITKEQYDGWFVTLPCACDYEDCQGWACINNDPLSIENHQRLYAPHDHQ